MKLISIKKIKEEMLFFIVLVLTIVISLFIPPSINAIDWKVIASLLNLMLVTLAFEKYMLLDKISIAVLSRFKTPRKIGNTMILTTALLSMFITNDVALITVVPLTIIIAKRAQFNPLKIIALETAAANLGSSLTPFGNPQNLYLYTYYKIPTIEFLKITLPFAIFGILLLLIINIFNDNEPLEFSIDTIKIRNVPKLLIYSICFILVLLSILRLVNYIIVTIILLFLFFVCDRQLFKKIDYFLLGTFILFFLFISSISRMDFIRVVSMEYLNTPLQTLTMSSIFSQFISNVPTAILLSTFTTQYKYLLLGVSLGGLGTMIASLANLISYKLYIKEYPSEPYSKYFYKINFLGFIILYAIIILML